MLFVSVDTRKCPVWLPFGRTNNGLQIRSGLAPLSKFGFSANQRVCKLAPTADSQKQIKHDTFVKLPKSDRFELSSAGKLQLRPATQVVIIIVIIDY